MKVIKDHDNYDYLSVSLKRAYADMIMKCYLALGWEDVHTEADKDYADMKYVLFSRPHAIANKDRLQYIQVRMENVLNRASERSIKKHRKSTALAVLFGILGLVFTAAGLCLALILQAFIAQICGWICVGLGAVFLLGLIYPLTKVRRDENKRLKIKLEQDYILFDKLVREAAELTSAKVEFKPLAAVEIAAGEGL